MKAKEVAKTFGNPLLFCYCVLRNVLVTFALQLCGKFQQGSLSHKL